MRATSMFLGLAAVWISVVGPARAGDSDASFRPVQFVSDGQGRGAMARVALTSEKDAEVTFARGARPVKGTWSVIGGPAIRFVGPDGRVDQFQVQGDGLQGPAGTSLNPEGGSPWLAAIFEDPANREWPSASPVDTNWARKVELVRLPGGEADWVTEFATIGVRVEERESQTIRVRFPDGSEKTLVRTPEGWGDTSGTAQELADRQRRQVCLRNLAQIGKIFASMRSTGTGKMKYGGAAWLLDLRKSKQWVREGDEELLRCPGDPHLAPLTPAVRKRYDSVDLANPPLDLCSYAVRDFSRFPIPGEFPRAEIIACCRQGADGRTPHHPGGIGIVYDDGRVRFLTHASLGISAGEPIVVGPDSTNEDLRKVVHVRKP